MQSCNQFSQSSQHVKLDTIYNRVDQSDKTDYTQCVFSDCWCKQSDQL